jgi:predicted methyltransferase
MRSSSLLAVMAIALTASAAVVAKDENLARAVTASHRSGDFVARDKYRRPLEELEFFGVKPNHTVVEIAPGGGYWTEILAPYLRDKGTLYTAVSERAATDWKKKLDANPEIYGKVKISPLGDPIQVAPAGSADLVLTFRNVHNWMARGNAEQYFAAFYQALKPGGVLGIEEHRAATDKPQDPQARNGYVREDYTIALAEKAGFKLLGKSELLANPKDTKDWPGGVWTLPPTLRLGEQDREKYLAIGEADNFLLKFQKPK